MAAGVLLGRRFGGEFGLGGQGTGEVAPSMGQPAAFAAFPLGNRGSTNRLRRDPERPSAALGHVFAKPALGAGHKMPVLVFVVNQISGAPWTSFEPDHYCLHIRRGQTAWNPQFLWPRIIVPVSPWRVWPFVGRQINIGGLPGKVTWERHPSGLG